MHAYLSFALFLLATAAPQSKAAPRVVEHSDCAIFKTVVERVFSDLYVRPPSVSLYHFGLTLPYPDAPLSAYLDRYFPQMPAAARASYAEALLPQGVAYTDYDRTDESDGYAPTCNWQGQTWSTEIASPFATRLILHRPSRAPNGRSALVVVRMTEMANYGHSVHLSSLARKLCVLDRRGQRWVIRECRETANLAR